MVSAYACVGGAVCRRRRANRGGGHGRRIVLAALKWARLRGAREAWLQVEADNGPATALYRSIGFREAYRYHYRRRAGT